MQRDDSTGKRPYRMQARAEAKAATGERILDAAIAVFDERPTEEVTLTAVAERAGVTVQTILRHYRSRQGVFEAAIGHVALKMGKDRGLPPIGDVKGAVGPLVDHYEEFGDRIVRMLSEELRNPTFHALASLGREFHAEWCKQAFAPALKGLRATQRERRLAQFVALTDIYMWKLLRRDRGLSRRQTKLALYELLEPLMEHAS